MATVSLCMIVRDEEEVIARCLDSVKDVVDEIIVVDTGSADRTKEIVRRYTDKVYDFEWCDDFSAARNAAFDWATMDYQMWMDADDILPQEEQAAFMALKQSLTPEVDMVTMRYHTHFDAAGNPTLTSTRERLMRRARGFRWQDPVHECIPLVSAIRHSDIAIWHQKPPGERTTDRNLRIYEGIVAGGGTLTPRQQYYFARELKDHRQYSRAAHYFELFLGGGKGWIEDNIAACYCLALCLRDMGEAAKVPQALLRSFTYAGPRPEICCELGYHHRRRGDSARALEWFEIATRLGYVQSLGFKLNDYWGYIPHIECCVCCCALGRYKEAWAHNEQAAVFKPESEAIQHNRRYLTGILNPGYAELVHEG